MNPTLSHSRQSASTNTKALVAFFTSSFPYPPGEQFIEPEIAYWSNLPWARVILCPQYKTGEARPVPADIEIIHSKRPGFSRFVQFALRAIFSPIFWREINYLRGVGIMKTSTCLAALKLVAMTLHHKNKTLALVKRYGYIHLAYCYWNESQAYAACLLKREGLINAVISRAHRFDLYEHRRRFIYMPLKRQFTKDFDTIFSISEEGRKYLGATYDFDSNALRVSRLGVRMSQTVSQPSTDRAIRIISVSSCIQIKRIDRIIDATASFCRINPDRKIIWTHIGDGPLRMKLEREAIEKLSHLPNGDFQFVGALHNKKVLEYYVENPVDIFINCSESEGIPVSIMEAMVHGIPAIAPAIGGIPELIDDTCGALLPENIPEGLILAAIYRLTGPNKDQYRSAAQQRIMTDYCADTNFSRFVAEARAICQDTIAIEHTLPNK